MKRPKLTRTDVINWWLQKYFNTNASEVAIKYPEEVKTAGWFELFPVTQEQHDEWYDWVISESSKDFRCSRARIKKRFAFDYLDCAPHIIKTSQPQ